MIYKYIVCSILILSTACSEKPRRYIELRTPFGEIAKGEVVEDNTFHGIVKYYDSTNEKYLGYTTFNYGNENGAMVRIKDGIITDSLYYEPPIKNGYEFLFDSMGRLSYKAYLLNSRVFGPAYEYDTIGKIKKFYFYNFEGEVLYQAKFESSGKYEKGSIINMKIYDRIINNEPKNVLFLYIIPGPNDDSYYEVAVLNEKKQVVTSKRINTTNFYYEAFLDPIPANQHYGVIYHSSNSKGVKDQITIQEIFL